MSILLTLAIALAGDNSRPPVCGAYLQAVQEAAQLSPLIVRLRPGETVNIGGEGQRLLQVREELAVHMQAGNPDLDRIERLMREDLKLREVIGGRVARLKLDCEIATLRGAEPGELRETLTILRPRTRAEIERQRNSPGRMLPAPPPMARKTGSK